MRTYLAAGLALLVSCSALAAEQSVAPEDPAVLQKMALEGDSNAQLNLGIYFATPHNAAPDLEQAAKWYRMAAEQGNAEAQYRLGDLYFHGRGVEASYEEAYFWFLLASRAGTRAFVIDRDDTARHLTPDEQAAIQKRAEAWTPRAKGG